MDDTSLNRRFYADVVWNLGSLAVIAVGGIAINVLIARYYGPEILGAFGQTLALFAIVAQGAVGGFALGLLHHLPGVSKDRDQIKQIFGSALYPAMALGFVVAAATFVSADFIGSYLESPLVSTGLKCAAPGVWLFAVNKCFLFAANALRRMRLFAVGQGLRVLLYFTVIVVMLWLAIDGAYLPLALTLGEAALAVFLYAFTLDDLSSSLMRVNRDWILRMIRFNRDGYLIGLLLDINLKVDIIVLGIFLADELVGIYAFMALFAEGFSQIPVVLQNNLNPLLSRLAKERRLHEVRAYIWQLHIWFVPSMIIMAVVATWLLPTISDIMTSNPRFGAGWPIFAILAGGIAVTAGISPLLLLPNQMGRPLAQSVLVLAIVATNIVLNVLLIPPLGLNGAAWATTATMILSSLYLLGIYRWLSGRWL
jgi:O-antigen/teichoic acid export membrane protein